MLLYAAHHLASDGQGCPLVVAWCVGADSSRDCLCLASIGQVHVCTL